MMIQVDKNIALEVYFDLADRKDGFDDEIRFRIYETGPAELRIFTADETSFLLTCEQAKQLALALQKQLPIADAYPGKAFLFVLKPCGQ